MDDMNIDITEVLAGAGVVYLLGAVDSYRYLRRHSDEPLWSCIVLALKWPLRL